MEIARLLVELLDRFPDDGAGLIRRIKDAEHEGDRLTHEVVDLLNRTFVTPFDRDDLYRLAGAIDDVCDHVDEAADNIALYGVRIVPQDAKAQADVILRAAIVLDEAVTLLDGFKDSREQLIELRSLEDEGDRLVREAVGRLDGFKDSRQQLIELRALEDEGDRLVRDAIAGLFRSGQDAVSILRWKDIYEQLEDAVDAWESAADVLEGILVKNR